MMVSVAYKRELEGIVDAMIEVDDDPKDIIDSCKDAVIESLQARGRDVPMEIKRLDVYR